MKNKRHRKKTRKLFNRELNGDFEKRLAAYGLTAAVLLAGPQSAKAGEVVWDIVDVTLSGVETIGFNLITGSAFSVPYNYYNFTQGRFAINLAAGPYIYGPAYTGAPGALGFIGFPGNVAYAAALSPSSSVGSAGNFVISGPWYKNFYAYMGDFEGKTGKSVGIRFTFGANVHYGWAQVDVGAGLLDMTLTAFGYNDTPGTPSHIAIPEPSSLGLLALGAAGLARRRKKTQV